MGTSFTDDLMSERDKITPEGAALGEAIRQLREQKRLKVRELADAMGVEEVTIKKLQRGVGTQHFFRLATLCRLLGTDPNSLLGFNPVADDEMVLGALEASYRQLGLPQEEAAEFASIVLEAIKEPPIYAAELSQRNAGRVLVELALRKHARPK